MDMTDAEDLDSQLHHEQFGPGHEYGICPCGCGVHGWFDRSYKPMRVAWKGWIYSCQVKAEVALIKAKYDTEIEAPEQV